MAKSRRSFNVFAADHGDDRGRRGKNTSGHIVQIAVLINGLILSIAAYFILNVFIQNMLADDHRRVLEDTRQVVSENLVNLEESIKAVQAIIALSQYDRNDELIRQRVIYAVPHLDEFDNIFWIRKGEDSKWRIFNIFSLKGNDSNMPALLTPGSEQSLIDYIIYNRRNDTSNNIQVMIDVPGSVYWQEYNDPVVKVRPFIIARSIIVGGEDKGMVVGLSRVTKVISKNWIDNRPELRRAIISDTITGRRIFYLDRDFKGGEVPETPGGVHDYTFQVGNTTWQLFVDIGKDAGSRFLQRTPTLILAFGLMLTAIGTLYVRSNQKQSFRLTSMNKMLAQKNYELNTEVSERERLNQSLRRAEREYRAIVDAVSDIIFELSRDGDILFLNDTWKRVTGMDIVETAGQNLFDMLHPQEGEEQRQMFEQMVKGQKHAYRSFVRLRTASGSYRSIELAMSMMRQDENKNMRVVGTITDVEERRRAERALGEAEKKFRTIVENAAGGIYQMMPDGKYLSANPAMARILGFETADQMVSGIRDAHEELYLDQKERLRFIRELETKGAARNHEAQIRRKDGKTIWVNENARAVKDDEGRVLYYEGSLEDITKRKEVENKLREAKIQSDLASRAKSEFLANMSHELRTPLNAIIGFSEIIKNEVLGKVENRQYWEYARDIYDSGKRLLTIINEILDVSRIDAGDRQLNEALVDMDKIVKSCVEFMKPKISAGELSVTNLMAGSVPNVVGEELAIKQVFLNLLSNAVKFTPNGGRITLSHEMDNEGQLRISITDTGIGLDEAEIEKALSPFGQVETAFSRSGSGAGLGLTLVDSLIKLHGGRLELFSQKGIGTTATIVFPARRVAVEGKARQPQGGRESSGESDSQESEKPQGAGSKEDKSSGDDTRSIH